MLATKKLLINSTLPFGGTTTVFDFQHSQVAADQIEDLEPSVSRNGTLSENLGIDAFVIAKRVFDIVISFTLLPVLALAWVILLLLNPFMNKGKLLFIQVRMGKDCKAFAAIKFRSMVKTDRITRGADDPLETHRITRLGSIMRKSRIDELPQLINVLKGEMSLIGPRPDYYHHARHYVQSIPGYRHRHAVLPGISGLAQTEVGYVQGIEATKAKVRADIYYINNAGFALDSWVFWRTLVTVFGHKGS